MSKELIVDYSIGKMLADYFRANPPDIGKIFGVRLSALSGKIMALSVDYKITREDAAHLADVLRAIGATEEFAVSDE